jgi:hypothetical protein
MTERASSQRSVAAQVWFVPLEVYNAAGDGGNALIAPIPASLALSGVAAYAENAVKQPSINVEEKIDRFVGRRTKTPDALSTRTSNKANSIAWRKAFGGVRVPRGVYRFKTHEEADQWLWQMITRPKN